LTYFFELPLGSRNILPKESERNLGSLLGSGGIPQIPVISPSPENKVFNPLAPILGGTWMVNGGHPPTPAKGGYPLWNPHFRPSWCPVQTGRGKFSCSRRGMKYLSLFLLNFDTGRAVTFPFAVDATTVLLSI
jgi:hypothetical protein